MEQGKEVRLVAGGEDENLTARMTDEDLNIEIFILPQIACRNVGISRILDRDNTSMSRERWKEVNFL